VTSPRTIQVVRKGPSSYQNPPFMVALGATSHLVSSGVVHAHEGGLIGLLINAKYTYLFIPFTQCFLMYFEFI